MIQTGNAELDAVFKAVCEQRENFADAVAMLIGKLKTQELLTAELQKQLEAVKPKEGDA